MERGALGGQRSILAAQATSPPRSVSSERQPSDASETRTGMLGAARPSSRSSPCSPDRRRVLANRDVAQPAARERIARPADRDQADVGREERGIPALGPVAGHRAPRLLAPEPLEPGSSPAKTIGTPGMVIWIPIPASWASREPLTVRKRAVSWLSSRFQEWTIDCHGTPRERSASWWLPPARPGVEALTGCPRSHAEAPPEPRRRIATPRRAGGSR